MLIWKHLAYIRGNKGLRGENVYVFCSVLSNKQGQNIVLALISRKEAKSKGWQCHKFTVR